MSCACRLWDDAPLSSTVLLPMSAWASVVEREQGTVSVLAGVSAAAGMLLVAAAQYSLTGQQRQVKQRTLSKYQRK